MEEIIFEDETYYLNNGTIYDSNFMECSKTLANEILRAHYQGKDYKTFNEREFLTHVKQLKSSGFYAECAKTILYGLTKFSRSTDFCITVFPMLTSCYRAIGTPQKAIDFWEENKSKILSCSSVPLYTSLAAAYCDVGDYELAKRYAKRAYATNGGSKEDSEELYLVFQRIKKETNDYN